MHFMRSLQQAWTRNDSLVCVGLDPTPAKFPPHLRDEPDAVFAFCAAIVDATADLVCAYKPQIAHFAALRAEAVLERLIAHIHTRHPDVPVILELIRGLALSDVLDAEGPMPPRRRRERSRGRTRERAWT